MEDIVLVDGARTPHGALLGGLADEAAVDLGTAAVQGLLTRTGVDPGRVDWVGLGNAVQAGVGQVPARQVALGSDLPGATPATTVNEASGSGLRAVALAADRLAAGRGAFAVAGGMESMSNAPYLVPELRRGRRHGDATLVDAMVHDSLWDAGYDAHMGELTERLVDRFDVAREAQDRYALESHRRAVDAIDEGLFAEEIVPVDAGDHLVDEDEGPRRETSMEKLARLSPAFRDDGTITAGNASNLSDGAGAVLLATAAGAQEAGLGPLAHVVDYAVAYGDPQWFGVALGDAVEALLAANDLSVGDVGIFELNEAFAAQMVYLRERLDIPEERLNPLGGAVALGHPIGASGGMLATTLAYAMEDADVEHGVVGTSVGGGGGIAVLLRR